MTAFLVRMAELAGLPKEATPEQIGKTLAEQVQGKVAPVGPGTGFSDAKAREIADNLLWLAQSARSRTAQEQAQSPSAAEFATRVEAEIAKGLTEVEALHAVAADFPHLYDAYRNDAFTDGRIRTAVDG